jgi:hypothetical protein
MDRLHEVTYHRWVPSAGKVITGRALFTDYKAAMAASEILDRWLGSMGSVEIKSVDTFDEVTPALLAVASITEETKPVKGAYPK